MQQVAHLAEESADLLRQMRDGNEKAPSERLDGHRSDLLGKAKPNRTRQAQDARGMFYERTGNKGVVRKSPKLRGRDRRLARKLAKQIEGR